VNDDLIYSEKVSSNKTATLFVALTLLFLTLLIWRMHLGHLDLLAALFLFFLMMRRC
jgi:hypothetical protein